MDSQSPSHTQYEEKLKALHLHATILAKTRSIKEIAEYTVDAMEKTLGFSWGHVSIVEGNLLKMETHFRDGSSGGLFQLPLDGPGITVRAARTGESQLISDTREDVDYIGAHMDENTISRLDDDLRGRVGIGEGEESLSEVDVPVKIDHNVVGVIGAESTELNAFTKQDQELLETLASHVASAIQRIRLLEAQHQYEAKLEALHNHANRLADTESINEIAEYTADAMENTLGFTWAGVSIVEDNLIKGMIQVGTASYLGGATPRSLDSPGIISRAIRTGETQLVADTRKDADYVGTHMDDSNLSKLDDSTRQFILRERESGSEEWASLSELEVPVKIGQSVVAIIGAESLELNAFTRQDQKLLETLASHVASAIQRLRLLEAKNQYEAKLEALHVHANKLADAKTLEEIAVYSKEALENTVRTDMLSWGDLGFVEDNIINYGFTPGTEFQELPLNGPGIIARAARTGEVQLITDTRKDVDFIGIHMDERTRSKLDDNLREGFADQRESGEESALSEIEVPVKIGDTVVGVIGGESTELNAFNEQDQKLLETLAGHIASAIQRIRAREEIRELAYRLNNLEPGGCYLSESHERCLKAFAVLSMEGVPCLCIIREDPQRLVDNYGIKKEEVVLLSSRPFEDWETLEDLQSVSRALSRFLESGEGVVLLDGLEYLITRFGFDAVFSFVQEKRFDFLKSKAVLLVPMDMETIEGREKALLSSEFTLLE